MSEYKAIKKLYEKIVVAITPEIDNLLTKAWAKDIIGSQQFHASLEPTATSDHKARVLISAIVARVDLDSTAFNKFLSLLREVSSLKYIADSLESEVTSIKMSTSHTASSEASNSNSTNDRVPRPPGEMPKLDLAEDLTMESGYGEAGQELGPIAGENVTDQASTPGSSDTFVHVLEAESKLYTKSFRKVVGGDSSIQGGAGVVVQGEADENLTIDSREENVSPISEASNSGTNQANQAMVVTSAQKADRSGSKEKDKDLTERSLDVILQENKRKNTRINQLEAELAICKHREGELEKEVDSLRKENERLEHQLHDKEKESKRSKEEHQHRIKKLESKLEEKEQEVTKIKTQLALVEQQNDIQQGLQERIKELEKEREELKSKVEKMNSEQKQKDLDTREKILELKEERNKKQAEEYKLLNELDSLKVKLANAQAEISDQKTEMTRKDLELEQEKRRNGEAAVKDLTEKLHSSQTELQKLQEEMNRMQLRRSSRTSQTEPLPSEVELNQTTSSFEQQTSRTESMGQVSRSTSAGTADPPSRQPSATESVGASNNTVQFELGSTSENEESTQDLESKAQDSDQCCNGTDPTKPTS